MPAEIMESLRIVETGTYVDMTLGDGGHSLLILDKLKAGGRLIAFDKDEEAIERVKKRFKGLEGDRLTIVNEDFSSVTEALLEHGIEKVDGFIFDLGVSSRQLDEAKRGFSFSKEARLDMRMDLRNEVDAYKLVNNLRFEDLYKIIKEYGEERFAKRIARSIIYNRAKEEITT
ncbi:16S rRNA (cytosine(1402)-N(4))-methyltransferase RsmH, partial [Thermodesulfobacteriota bacterium]